MRKTTVFILFISLCLNIVAQKSDTYYDKHIIIAVDQKAAAVNGRLQKYHGYPDAMNTLYKGLSSILSDPDSRDGINESMSIISSGFKFNPNTDCISLFAYGIPKGSLTVETVLYSRENSSLPPENVP